jgi:hypothetical protein
VCRLRAGPKKQEESKNKGIKNKTKQEEFTKACWSKTYRLRASNRLEPAMPGPVQSVRKVFGL